MPLAKLYRHQAEFCVEAAGKARDPELAQRFHLLALDYLEKAIAAEADAQALAGPRQAPAPELIRATAKHHGQ